jgi:hypothetical protein
MYSLPALHEEQSHSQDRWDAMSEDGDGGHQGTDQTAACSLRTPGRVKTHHARALSDGLISGVLAPRAATGSIAGVGRAWPTT